MKKFKVFKLAKEVKGLNVETLISLLEEGWLIENSCPMPPSGSDYSFSGYIVYVLSFKEVDKNIPEDSVETL